MVVESIVHIIDKREWLVYNNWSREQVVDNEYNFVKVYVHGNLMEGNGK